MTRVRVLLALSNETPAELVAPIEASLSAEGAEVVRADLGRVGTGVRAIDRVVQAILGETEHRRLQKELTAFAPDVAVALDPGAAAALVRERERGGPAAPVVAVVAELAPRLSWSVDADRYVAVDDEAAVALSDLGVDGARVQVVGAIARHAWAVAGREARAELRARFKLPAREAVLLIEAANLPIETLSQLVLQMSLLGGRPAVLFDAGDDADAAAHLRRQVPPLGLRGKLFGEIADAPSLWRCADVVLARPRPRAVMTALAVGAAFVALEPQGEREQVEARALVERGIGQIATKVLLVAAAIEPFASADGRAAAVRAAEARRSGEGRGAADAAATIARLVCEVAADRENVLAETRAAAAARVVAGEAARVVEAEVAAKKSAPPGELEDLGGDDFPDTGGATPPVMGGPDAAMLTRLRADLDAAETRARKVLQEVRADIDRWEQRRVLAEQKGQTALATDAAREADRKRARMHSVLEELARLATERTRLEKAGRAGSGATAAAGTPAAKPSPTIDDQVAAMKREASKKGQTVDAELAALKRKMQTEKKSR